jgi:hypothetical protein
MEEDEYKDMPQLVKRERPDPRLIFEALPPAEKARIRAATENYVMPRPMTPAEETQKYDIVYQLGK